LWFNDTGLRDALGSITTISRNVMSACGASIFDNYDKQEVGDWLMITCEKCDTVIKKYF
jgi:hypothetical protein